MGPTPIAVGAMLVKEFNSIYYTGIVTDHDREKDTHRVLYGVQYEDGDREDLYANEVRQLLVREATQAVPTASPTYVCRKEQENKDFLDDCRDHLRQPLEDIHLLALDDFVRPGETFPRMQRPHTMDTWIGAGGRPHGVWVPNPDYAVVAAVNNWGGHGFREPLSAFLRRHDVPRFHALYLDSCGFFKSLVPDLKHLLKNHGRLLGDSAVMHLTTARREGISPGAVAKAVLHLVAQSGYGEAICLRSYTTATMNKGAFLLTRKTYPLRSRHGHKYK